MPTRYTLRDPYSELSELQKANQKSDDYYIRLYNLRKEIDNIHEDMPYITEGEKVDIIESKSKSKNTKTKNTKKNDKVKPSDYPFNTEEECLSNKRSANYYISKSDLVNLLKGDSSVSVAFKKGINKRSKDELCKEVFNK